MNSEIGQLHRQAEALLELVKKADNDELASIKTAANQLCQFLYTTDADSTHYRNDFVHADLTFSYLLPVTTSLSDEQKTIWLNIILIMQMNTKLGGQDKMSIYTITADSHELASSHFNAFFGFLDVRFRHHDYLIGRLKARQMINQIIEAVKKGDHKQLPLKIEPLDTNTIETELKPIAKLCDANMSDVDLKTRKKLYKRLKDRSYRIMKIMKLNGFVCGLIFYLALRVQLKKFLHL